MHYLRIALLKVKLNGNDNAEKQISQKIWGVIPRAEQNLKNAIKKHTTVKDSLIQEFCNMFDLEITFSKDKEPEVKINE